MVPPVSAGWLEARSLTSAGAAGVSAKGCLAGGVGGDLASGLDLVRVLVLTAGLVVDLGCGAGLDIGDAPLRRRSSSMEATAVWGCHSSMAPARMGVARSCWTGGGAAPAAAKASGDSPAEWPRLLKSWTR